MKHLAVKRERWIAALFLSILLALRPLPAQQNTGSIRGLVQDSQGAVVPGATVVLENQLQRSVAGQTTTGPDGTFIFTGLFASTYSITVTAPGFKTYKLPDIVLRIGDNIGLPPAVLEVGAVSESITVSGTAVEIDTVSATRAGVVNTRQMVDLLSLGRNYSDYMKLVPGAPPDNPTNINGQRSDQISYAVDGVTMMDSGNNSNYGYRINVDAIAEFKVVANSQSAEYGRSSGAMVTVVTKSGTSEFHGGGYYFKKGEWMNARTFVDNYNNVRKSLNRVLVAGYNLSGPLYIPGKFNSNKDKLFFFVSHEYNRSKGTQTQTLLMPTAEERVGDFSASRTSSGQKVTVIDPLTGAPFPGNQIPSNRWSYWGKKILDFYWLPNLTGALQTDPSYNDRRQFDTTSPQFDQIYRFDYNVTQNHRFFIRHTRNRTDRRSPCGFLNSGNSLCLTSLDDKNGAWSVSTSFVSILSPTLTNEFLFGSSRNYLPVSAPKSGSPYYRSASGLQLPLLYSNADPIGLIPNISFGVGPSSSFQGLPYANENPIVNFSDNLTKIVGNHTFKFGIFIEDALKTQSIAVSPNGSYSFAPDTSNPGNTTWGYANALLGNFTTFSQASKFHVNDYRYKNYEWYAQDTWKVRANLTLNLGLRFAVLPPIYEDEDKLAAFVPSAYDSSQAVKYFEPVLVGSARMARNPLTGAIMPSSFIGKIVPGYGDVNNGMLQAGHGLPRGLYDSRGVQYGPRIGVAWTPAGPAGKTVLRAGGGVFFERIQMNPTMTAGNNPPIVRSDTIYYDNIDTFLSGSVTKIDSPTAVSSLSKEGMVPTTYNFNAGLQRQMPGNIMIDVAYVGSLARHLATLDAIHGVPFGSAWLPENQDPTKPLNLNGDNALPADFRRPYMGYTGSSWVVYGAGGMYRWGGTSNYHGLQASARRRAGRYLQFGANYTWSKALGVQSNLAYGALNPLNVRKANYGPLSYDRRHTLTIDYILDVPSVTKLVNFLNNPAGKAVLDGWQLSGITTFSSGGPTNISYSVFANYTYLSGSSLNRRVTGSDDFGPRIVYLCNPVAASPTIEHNFNENCLAPAAKGSVGMDSGVNSIVGPGINNWDVAIYKKIQFWKERPERFIQLRVELYNAPNHTQWSAINTSATFDGTGKILNLPASLGGSGGRFGFGAYNANRAARNIQLAAKIYF